MFVAGSLPNLLFSPVAGALVDRWDQKQVLVVSDILRAALVLLVPVTISINVWLAYVIVFLITTVSIFFRPARIAILPRLVDDADLLPANSAMWVGETIADVVELPARRPVRAVPRQLGRPGVLVRRRDVPRVGRPARDDGRAADRPPRRGRRPRRAPRATPSPSRRPAACRPSPTSGATSRRAGRSCAPRRSCSRTPCRARRRSWRSAS